MSFYQVRMLCVVELRTFVILTHWISSWWSSFNASNVQLCISIGIWIL